MEEQYLYSCHILELHPPSLSLTKVKENVCTGTTVSNIL